MHLKYFIRSTLLITTPAMVAYPHEALAAHAKSTKHHKSSHNTKSAKHHQSSRNTKNLSFQIKDGCAPTYDELMAFIREVEKTDLRKCSPEQLEQINRCLAQLAKAGFVSDEHCDEKELDNDIQELLYGEGSPSKFALASAHANDYVFAPTDIGWEVQLARFHYFGFGPNHNRCLKRGSHTSTCARILNHTSKFVQKHKTAIFIGAVVIAATVAIVITCGGATPYVAPATADAIASITAAGAAGGAAAAASNPNERNESYPSRWEPTPSLSPPEKLNIPNALDLSIGRALDQRFMEEECIASIKELLSESEPIQALRQSNQYEAPGSAEVARGIASSLIHELYDEVASYIPPPLDLPRLDWNPSEDRQFSPMGTREQAIAAGHQVIDQVFSTDMAGQFTPEGKAINKTVIGIIPLPGASGTVSVSRNTGKIAGTQATAVRGWTVGEPITNLTAVGNVPRWSTVRARYWKGRAEWAKSNPSHKYGDWNLPRMENGLAPQKFNSKTGKWESMELHHNPAQKDGGLFDFIELWPEEHAAIDPLRNIGD